MKNVLGVEINVGPSKKMKVSGQETAVSVFGIENGEEPSKKQRRCRAGDPEEAEPLAKAVPFWLKAVVIPVASISLQAASLPEFLRPCGAAWRSSGCHGARQLAARLR